MLHAELRWWNNLPVPNRLSGSQALGAGEQVWMKASGLWGTDTRAPHHASVTDESPMKVATRSGAHNHNHSECVYNPVSSKASLNRNVYKTQALVVVHSPGGAQQNTHQGLAAKPPPLGYKACSPGHRVPNPWQKMKTISWIDIQQACSLSQPKTDLVGGVRQGTGCTMYPPRTSWPEACATAQSVCSPPRPRPS